MNGKSQMVWKSALLGVLVIMLSVAGLCVENASAAGKKTVKAGAAWVVDKTTNLKRLEISDGGDITAPEGFDLTLTVDGVGTAIAPGSYKGDIVLTVTEAYPVKYRAYDYLFRAAVVVKDGKLVKEQSVAAAAGNAVVDDAVATDVTIISREENFNGIVVTGDSPYTVNNARIDMTGNGANDFAGVGAAIMSTGNAMLTINNADIKTRGAGLRSLSAARALCLSTTPPSRCSAAPCPTITNFPSPPAR